MLSVRTLEKTGSSVLFELPLGKPNPHQTRKTGQDELDDRERIKQEAFKGNTCWYSTFNFVRKRVGKVPSEESKKEREIEVTCSLRRKALTALEYSLPAITDQLHTETVRNFLSDIDHDKAIFFLKNKKTYQTLLETPATLEGSPSLFSFMEEFTQESKHCNMYEFLLEKKFEKWNEINIRFLTAYGIDPRKMFEVEITPKEGYKEMQWEKIDSIKKAAFLDCFVRKISAEKYGLKISAWTPLKPIDDLIKELVSHGPLVVFGALGQISYCDQPFKMGQKLHDKDIYAWKPGAKRHAITFFGHAILLVGAKKVQEKAYVFFIDPKDASDPKDRSSQKLYMVSYANLTQHACDLHGRRKSDSSEVIGYGYYGNFKM